MILVLIAVSCSHSSEGTEQPSESSSWGLFCPKWEHQSLSLEAFLSHTQRALQSYGGLPRKPCPSLTKSSHTAVSISFVPRFTPRIRASLLWLLVCMYLFICWDVIGGKHLVSRTKRYSFSHLYIRHCKSFRHWHGLNGVHQPSEMCDLCLLFSLCMVCALCCVCLRNKPLISSGRWVPHVPSFLCLPECLCFWTWAYFRDRLACSTSLIDFSIVDRL